MGCFPDKTGCLGRNEVREGTIGPLRLLLRYKIEAPPFLAKHRIGPDGIPVGAEYSPSGGNPAQPWGCAYFLLLPHAGKQAFRMGTIKNPQQNCWGFPACSVTPTGFKPVTF